MVEEVTEHIPACIVIQERELIQLQPGRLVQWMYQRVPFYTWKVPGLWYRVLREVLKRTLGVRLPLEPRGPKAWERGWRAWRGWLARRRWALYTVMCVGIKARKPART